MTTDELATLTTDWRGLPWETRDLFARWLSVTLANMGIQKRQRIDAQAALLDLDGDAPEATFARRLRMARRDSDQSMAELQAKLDAIDNAAVAS